MKSYRNTPNKSGRGTKKDMESGKAKLLADDDKA